MKRTLLVFGLIAVLFCTNIRQAHAQFVVSDPGHTALNATEWITNVKQWISQINEMIDAQELRLGLQKIDQLKELQSLKELADLLDDVACLSSEYSFYLNVGSNYHCLKFLNFQRVTVNLSLSTGSHGDQLFLHELGRTDVVYRTSEGICREGFGTNERIQRIGTIYRYLQIIERA